MAKRRELKKDVDYLVTEVVSDCYTYMLLNGDKNRDKAVEIIESILKMRNEVIRKINTPGKKDAKANRAYFKELHREILEGVDSCFTKLSELTKE